MEVFPFYQPELERSIDHFDSEAMNEAIDMLKSSWLHEQITQGNVTLAMIRPHVGPEANQLGLNDTEAAERIEQMISGLGYLAKFSFKFTADATREFYGGGPEASMSQEPPRNPDDYPNRWPEFVDFMTSGTTTAVLLYSPDGDAITKWRAHLGHWNIDEVRDPETIRGALGVNKYNNLVHGSDAPESVLRELDIITRCLEAQAGLYSNDGSQ